MQSVVKSDDSRRGPEELPRGTQPTSHVIADSVVIGLNIIFGISRRAAQHWGFDGL